MDSFIQRLESLSDDITALALLTNSLAKQAKQLQNPYTRSLPLRSKARAFFGCKEASIKEMIDFLLKLWKSERRLSPNGRTVRLGQEARLFDQVKETSVDIYDVYTWLSEVQKQPKPAY